MVQLSRGAFMEARKIDCHTWSIEDGFVRAFLIEGKEKAVLLDTCASSCEAPEIAAKLTDKPIQLVNTHADRDHIKGNSLFPVAFMHDAETVNYYNINKAEGRTETLDDMQKIDLGERILLVILIPGHTPGSIALLDMKNGYLFPGDSVQDGDIYMFGIMRDFNAYIHSLKKLLKFRDRITKIFPSHGTCPLSPLFISSLAEQAELYMKGMLEKEEILLPDGRKVLRAKAEGASFLVEK